MQSKWFHWILFVGLLASLICPSCSKKKGVGPEPAITGPTTHSGWITQDETWYTAGNPHIIEGTVYVDGGFDPTLTIEAGVIVKFKPGGSLVIGEPYSHEAGTLIAEGTPEKPIKFTSYEGSPYPGAWGWIMFGSAKSKSILNHCIFEYGGFLGGFFPVPTIYAICYSISITNCTVREGIGGGVWLGEVESLIFEKNRITKNNSYPISLSSLVCAFEFTKDNDFSGNTIDRIYVVDSQYIDKSGTLPNIGVPYEIGDLHVNDVSNPILTIEPGCELLFRERGKLWVGLSNYWDFGSVVAIGTPEQPIIFTSASFSPQPGDWSGILFSPSREESTLKHCVIAYGGRYYPSANILVNGASPTITNNIIKSSMGWGIYISSGSPVITENTFSNNPSGDIGP